jgi:hypothetical protein
MTDSVKLAAFLEIRFLVGFVRVIKNPSADEDRLTQMAAIYDPL